MEIRVRPALPSDVAAIAHVHVASWRTTYRGIVPDAYLDALDELDRQELWQRVLDNPSVTLLVAEDPTGIFGFVAGGAIRQPIPGYDAELHSIYLLRDRHRHGAGRALVRQLAADLQAQGFASMAVWVLEVNPAVGFYRRLGAVPIVQQWIEIGGVNLMEVAHGWPDLRLLTA